MPRKRADSFKIAFETVKAELRSGVHPPGARLTANEIAERLDLSQTPVREALSRLAGEGLLLDRRGQGFFVPSLSEDDLVVLFRLQQELLRIATDGDRPTVSGADVDRILAASEETPPPERFAIAGERLLRMVAASASPLLARHLARLHDQLARVRIAEAQILDRLADELDVLSEAVAGGNGPAMRVAIDGYFERRIQAAPLLARLQINSPNIESI